MMGAFKINYLIVICLLFFTFSCSNSSDRKEIKITSFEEKIIDSLVPMDRSYTTYYIKIKGYANDYIKIIPGKENSRNFSFYYKGKIDEELKFDYYGGSARSFVFDPYKATDGELIIEYKLL